MIVPPSIWHLDYLNLHLVMIPERSLVKYRRLKKLLCLPKVSKKRSFLDGWRIKSRSEVSLENIFNNTERGRSKTDISSAITPRYHLRGDIKLPKDAMELSVCKD